MLRFSVEGWGEERRLRERKWKRGREREGREREREGGETGRKNERGRDWETD